MPLLLVLVAPLASVAACADSEPLAENALDAGVTEPEAAVVPTPVSCEAGTFCGVELPPEAPVTLNGIWGSGPGDVWIVGSPGTTIHWDGAAFTRAIEPRRPMLGVWGSGAGDVWSFGTSQTLWHSQAFASGGGWSPSSGKTGGNLRGYPTPILAMWGSSASDVWAVGASLRDSVQKVLPSVLHCDGWRDGEPSWQVSPTGDEDPPAVEPVSFNAICGSAASGVWIVGEGGKTRYTSGWKDGGASWTWVNSHSSRSLYAVWCAPNHDVWAAGEGGTIHRFSRGDGGDYAAVTMETPVIAALRALWGSADDDIWAAGDQGTLIHWDGKAWALVRSPSLEATKPDLFAVWGSSKDDVWIAGRDILIRKGNTQSPGKIQ